MGIVKKKKSKLDLKGHFSKLREDLAPMTFKEKMDHIWTYYKEYMLVVFCVLLIVGGTLVAFLMPKPEILLAGVQCNMKLTTEGYDYLTKDYRANVLDGAEGSVYLHTHDFYGEGTVDAVEHTSKAYYSVAGYVEAKELDYMLLDLYSFRYFGSDRIYMDLRELLSEEELADLDARGMVLYEEAEGSDETVPRAINIADTAFCQEHLNTEECYLVFIRNTPRFENCEKLWEYIKNYE